MATRKASDVFVECLEAEGVTHVFGIPGEETLDLNESLANSSVSFIPVRHEQGGAYMADMYGRLTRRAGVCLGTLGPGATNLVTAIADAWLDRSPVVALTGQGDLATGATREFASGLRNPNGMAWEPRTGTLWTVVNERDELGSDLVPDYMTSVKEGGFYGWPFSYWGRHVDTRVKPPNPAKVAEAIVPDYALGNHTASLGLAFSEGTLLPEHLREGAFIGQHGSWNRDPPAGYKVIFVPFRPDDRPADYYEDFVTGFVLDEREPRVWGRPTGIIELPDGSRLPRHRDPYAGSLRYHLGLITPNDDRCFIEVDGERYSWRDGEGVMFDETYLHYAENQSGQNRLILFCDIERPMRYRWAQAVNHWLGRNLMSAATAPNEEGDRTGGVNKMFKYIYAIRRVGKRLKAWNRTGYYIIKWILFGGIAAAIFFSV